MENNKVLLGMSGGVDSSVSAYLLKKKGYDVIGVTLELYRDDTNENNEKNIKDAKEICDSLDISHFSYDFTDEFKRKVIDNFVECYAKGLTPNPCIECNKYLKFGKMYEKAKELGCRYIATGHYAKVEYSDKYNRYVLKKSKAGSKDQSYVLWSIPKELLEHIIFPLEDFESKEDIRKIARDNNLKVASKKDSEDICFIPDGDYVSFLENKGNVKPKKGNIVDENGNILGMHNGLYAYTIGKRRGIGVSSERRLYVTGFNKEKNELVVGDEKFLYKDEIRLCDVNLLAIDSLNNEVKCTVKTRYSAKEAKATIYKDKNEVIVKFDSPQKNIAAGQSCVFYDGDIVLGGGKII